MNTTSQPIGNTNFGLYFRQKRIAAGLSQSEVSARLNYTTSQFVSNWERGKSLPPPKAIKKLAFAINVDLRELSRTAMQAKIQKSEISIRRAYGSIR